VWALGKIVWEDAHGVTQEWSEEDIKPLICESVGYLKECDNFWVVCPHYNEETGQGCGKMAIPKSAVREIVKFNTLT